MFSGYLKNVWLLTSSAAWGFARIPGSIASLLFLVPGSLASSGFCLAFGIRVRKEESQNHKAPLRFGVAAATTCLHLTFFNHLPLSRGSDALFLLETESSSIRL